MTGNQLQEETYNYKTNAVLNILGLHLPWEFITSYRQAGKGVAAHLQYYSSVVTTVKTTLEGRRNGMAQ